MKNTTMIFVCMFLIQACSLSSGKKFSADADDTDTGIDGIDSVDGIDGVDGIGPDGPDADDSADVPEDAVDMDGEGVTPGCGNGVREEGEECDWGDGNSDSEPDACRTDCRSAHCGDGVMDSDEGCDDGNDNDDDECRNNCSLPTCGNGELELGEDCDDGDDDNTDDCLDTCRFASCGDEYIHDGEEECDDGRNGDDGDGCTDDCDFSCEDHEDCDDGNVCTDNFCEEGGEGKLCTSADNEAPCDDLNPCTDGDTCSGGECIPGENVCECEENEDCEEFDDDDLCNGSFYCNGENECEVDPETIVECADLEDTECTKNLCDPDTGECSMTHLEEGTECEDDDPCNENDACNGEGDCVGEPTGLTDCDGECVDLSSDPDHCGDCETACLFDEDCLGAEGCVIHPWTAVGGPFPDSDTFALAHAISTNGSAPYLAMIESSSSDVYPVSVMRRGSDTWTGVAALADEAVGWDMAVDLDFNGSNAYLAFLHRNNVFIPPTNVKLKHCDGTATCTDEFYEMFCLNNYSINMDLRGADAHFTTVGMGGCGVGVGYAWWEAGSGSFHEHLGNGLLPWEGNGKPSVLVTHRPYVGILARDNTGMATDHVYVAFWDPISARWYDHGGDLREHSGECFVSGPGRITCSISLAAGPFGDIHAAWTENDDDGAHTLIYVKRYWSSAWHLLGGAVNAADSDTGFGSGGNPKIHVTASGYKLIAYQDHNGTSYQVFVKMWNGESWARMGPALNNNNTNDAIEPDITIVDGVVYVSFLEDTGSGDYKLHVKSFP